jgi:hypothetical protein
MILKCRRCGFTEDEDQMDWTPGVTDERPIEREHLKCLQCGYRDFEELYFETWRAGGGREAYLYLVNNESLLPSVAQCVLKKAFDAGMEMS